MPDAFSIAGAIKGLETAGKMVGAFSELRDQALVQGKVIELQGVILSAQQSALAAQGEQLALLEEKRQLERELSQLEAWQREKDRYELVEVRAGAFAYALKAEAQGGEPPHRICSGCYERGHKSILQEAERPPRIAYLRCHDCGLEIVTRGVDDGARPQRPQPQSRRSSVFSR